MKLIVNKDRSVIPVGTWGTVNENDYEILEFEFPAELDEYNKRIVYYLGDEKVWDAIVNNKAYITNAITTKGDVKAYVWCTKENTEREADTDFRTMLFEMHFYENENADGIVPTEEQVDGFNTMLTAMNAKIDEVDALEQTIGAAEAQRQEAEATRVSNENTRESNESTRQTNEQTRQSQEAERERRTDEAIENIEDKTAEYNQNAEEKTMAFNTNATQKTNDFNSNYTQKVNDFNTNASSKESAFNSNASSKTSDFNSNAETKTNAFNTNATNKTNDFNSNATEKTTTFNDNASTKTTEFNTNAETKITAFNTNATEKTNTFNSNATDKTTAFDNNASSKTTDFNTNASDKTDEFNDNAQDKIDEYDEHVSELTAEIDDLQQEVEELSENMPWSTTEQATEISVDDAAKYSRNKLELFGNAEQAQYTGKNLLPYPYTESSKTTKGITFTDNGDGSITINGTAQGNSSFTLFGSAYPDMQENFPGNYILGKNCSYSILCRAMYADKQESGSVIYRTVGQSTGTSVQMNTTQYPKGYVEIMVLNGTTVDNVTIYPMITDTQDNDYEPYTGGVPSPNPDYPQPIHVVTGNNTIEVQGKNLFDKNVERKNAFSTGDIGQVVGYGNSSASYSYVNCAKVEANKTYTLSWKIDGTKGATSNRNSKIVDSNNIVLEEFATWINNTTHITFTPQNTGYLVLTTDISSVDIQLEQGSIATSYVPYYHADYPIDLGSLELCKIKDYQDYLYKENGNWYKDEAIKKYIINENTKFYVSKKENESTFCFQIENQTSLTFNNNFLRSNFYPNKVAFSTYACTNIYNKDVWFSNPYDSNFTLEMTQKEARAKFHELYDNKLYYYTVKRSNPTQITDETLISQLDAIYEHLKLVKGTNNITVTAEDLKPLMKLTYMQDLPSKLDNLDSRLSLLE